MRYLKPLLFIPFLALIGCPAAEKPAPTPPKAPGGMSRMPAIPKTGDDAAPKEANGDAAPKEKSDKPSEPAQAKAGAVAINPDNTKIEFVGTKPEGKHDGGFKSFTGDIELNDKGVSKINVNIDTESLWADNPKLTGHLKSVDFFDVKTHPKASFVSTEIKVGAAKDATHVIEGVLTLHGEKKAISFPAKIEVAASAVNLSSEFKINRSEFGITYGKGKVDEPVTIKVAVRAARK
jgi:polyisoprenoid-binding protein YceI